MQSFKLKSAAIICFIFFAYSGCQKPESSDATNTATVSSTSQKETLVRDKVILFFGNSLTAGYGVEPEEAFPHLIQVRLDSLNGSYKVINGGLSGETTASGVNRIEWVLREEVHIMVLELGGNDGLRGVDPKEVRQNLQKIIDLAQSKYPAIQIVMAGMEAPPNMGENYISEFRKVYGDLATENQLPLIPFLLEGVGGESDLNLPDGIHPNQEGHAIVAENVWQVLSTILES